MCIYLKHENSQAEIDTSPENVSFKILKNSIYFLLESVRGSREYFCFASIEIKSKNIRHGHSLMYTKLAGILEH